jgi:hypothetical protein
MGLRLQLAATYSVDHLGLPVEGLGAAAAAPLLLTGMAPVRHPAVPLAQSLVQESVGGEAGVGAGLQSSSLG